MTAIDKPIARATDLVIEPTGAEILIFDERDQTAHCLDRASAAVWSVCDGTRTVDEIAAQCDLAADVVEHALTRLTELSLMETASGVSRRDMVRRSAVVAGTVVAYPVVKSIIAPTPAMAGTCVDPGQLKGTGTCCSGNYDAATGKCL